MRVQGSFMLRKEIACHRRLALADKCRHFVQVCRPHLGVQWQEDDLTEEPPRGLRLKVGTIVRRVDSRHALPLRGIEAVFSQRQNQSAGTRRQHRKNPERMRLRIGPRALDDPFQQAS